VPLYDVKFGAECTVSATRIVGSIFFSDTINSERYNGKILASMYFFFFYLIAKDRDYGFFQQDGATAHTPCNSMAALQALFW
jgi:hypothetical protein